MKPLNETKVVPVLRHEDICDGGCINPRFLNLGAQSLSGLCGEERWTRTPASNWSSQSLYLLRYRCSTFKQLKTMIMILCFLSSLKLFIIFVHPTIMSFLQMNKLESVLITFSSPGKIRM